MRKGSTSFGGAGAGHSAMTYQSLSHLERAPRRGYTAPNVARCWTLLTLAAARAPPPTDIPPHAFFGISILNPKP